jgi:hypothetical protein
MTRRLSLATIAFIAATTWISAANAQSYPAFLAPSLNAPPAVSAPNGKIGLFGGSIVGVHGAGLVGALSIPVGPGWGAQVDGLAGTAGGNTFWGLGGHLFWRDPRVGLLGAYASHVDWTPFGALVQKVGVEGELYQGAWTVSGLLAMQSGTFSGPTGHVTAALYLNENLRFDATLRLFQGSGNIGHVGFEWQQDRTGLAVFGTAGWGDSGYSTALAGVKLYTGPAKSLIRRHREDDPGVTVDLDLELAPRDRGCREQTMDELQLSESCETRG